MRPYMRAANVTWDGISLHDVKEMDFTDTEFGTYALCEGDILLSEASGSASEVGKPAIWRGQVPGACFQNTLIRVRSKSLALVPYLYWHFIGDARNMRFAHASRGTGIHHLGSKTVERWATWLPPLPEQRRIVAEIEKQFTRLDVAVASLERVKANLKRARASVLKAAVEGRLVPTEAELARAEGRDYEPASVLLERILEERERKHEEAQEGAKRKKKYKPPVEPDTEGLPELPEGWAWASAEAVCLGVDSGTTPKAEHFVEDGGAPFIKVYNLTFTGALDFTVNPCFVDWGYHNAKMQRSVARPGDVLTNIVGPPLGKVSIVPPVRPIWNINQAIARFSMLPGVENAYLATYLQSPVSQRWLQATARTTTSQVNLAITTCRKLPVPIPPYDEQTRIVGEVGRRTSVIDAITEAVSANLARCSRLRQSILKRAFEGKLVPQDPNDEPASELLARIQAEAAKPKPAKKKSAKKKTAAKKKAARKKKTTA